MLNLTPRRLLTPATGHIALVLLTGLALRAVLAPIPGFGYDAWAFQLWTQQMLSAPLSAFYAADLRVPQDHLPGDLWLLYGLGHAWDWLGLGAFTGYGAMVALKTVPIAFDLALASIAAAAVRSIAGRRAGWVALLAIVFNPALVFVSSIWGQWNVVAATLAVVAVVAVASWGAPGVIIGLQALAAASLVKPQLLILLLPLAVFAIREHRRRQAWRELLVGTAVGGIGALTLVLAMTVPFDVGLPGMGMRWTIVERVEFAADRYTRTTLNAYNLWAWLEPGQIHTDQDTLLLGVTFQMVGLLLFGIAVAYALWLVWRWPDATRGLLVAAAIVTTALFMLLTRSHERYLVDGMVFAVLAGAAVPRLRPAAALLTLGCFINIWAVYGTWFEPGNRRWSGLYPPWWFWWMSTVNLVGFALLLWGAWPRRGDAPIPVMHPAANREREETGAVPLDGAPRELQEMHR